MLDPTVAFHRLRAAGLRLTPQRRAVVESLVGDTSHPTAEEVRRRVRERLPETSTSTVYKILHELTGLGLARELDVPGPARFDPSVDDHVHVVCPECDGVSDAMLPPQAARLILEAAGLGSDAHAIDVTVRVRCDSCAGPSPAVSR